jgi:hypothetical protein
MELAELGLDESDREDNEEPTEEGGLQDVS